MAFICEALGVSRSGFYAWLTRGPSARSRREEVLSAKIKSSFAGQRSNLRRSAGVARPAGCRNRVRSARGRASDAAQRAESASKRRRLPIDIGDRPAAATSANVLDRQFEAPAPNRKWVADITYIWTREGWLYVAAVWTCTRAGWSVGRWRGNEPPGRH